MNEAQSPSHWRILVVDDQDDVRRLLVRALEMEGYQVDEAGSAPDGLRRLQWSHYDLVLADHAMPRGTGAWMLHEATRRGLMERSVGLIITAHPGVGDIANGEVVTKPFHMDRFLEQVRRLLATAYPERRSKARLPAGQESKVELVLYVSSTSPASMEAAENLERLLARYQLSEVRMAVHDLARTPLAAEEDRIAFTPTLVKRYPEPRMWMLGNLRDPEILEDLLSVCGVATRSPAL